MLIFRLLRSALCEALAQVQASAALLYLQQPAAPAGGPHAGSAADVDITAAGPASAAAARQGQEESLFQRADRLVAASLAGVAAAFRQLEASVHATLDAQQGPAPPPAQDRLVLQGALTRVLGLGHLRRVFSRLQLQQAGGGGGGAPGVAAEAVLLGDPAAAAAAGQAQLDAAAGSAAAPLSVAAALAEARAAVGCTLVLPADASVHSALVAAQRSARAMRARRIVQVCQLARGFKAKRLPPAAPRARVSARRTPPSGEACTDVAEPERCL